MTHDELLELTPLYALDALDGDDRARFETHLASCAECARRILEFAEASKGLADALPPRPPSPALKRNILSTIRSSAKPAIPFSYRLGMAASLLLVLGFGLLGIHLSRVAAKYQTEMERLHSDLESVRRENEFFQTASVARMKGGDPSPTAAGTVLYRDRKVFLLAGGLPDPPAGMKYELWVLLPEKLPIPAGVYGVQEGGTIRGPAFEIDLSLFQAQFAITLEPEAGVSSPTGAKYLVPDVQ